jgi:hypothetical protein
MENKPGAKPMNTNLARYDAELVVFKLCTAAPKIGEDLDSWLMPGVGNTVSYAAGTRTSELAGACAAQRNRGNSRWARSDLAFGDWEMRAATHDRVPQGLCGRAAPQRLSG